MRILLGLFKPIIRLLSSYFNKNNSYFPLFVSPTLNQSQFDNCIQQQNNHQEEMTTSALSRKNQKISFETREQLIRLVVEEKKTIKEAGKKLGLKKSTSKMIIKKFKKHGFITKFKKQKELELLQVLQLQEQQNVMKLSQSQSPNKGYYKSPFIENVSQNCEFFDYSTYFWPTYMMNPQLMVPMVFQYEPIPNFYL